MDVRDVFEILKARPADSHKGSFGTLNIIAGSAFYRGAASLNVMAALRTGCGIVCLCSTEKVISAAVSHICEATFYPLCEAAEGNIAGNEAGRIATKAVKGSCCLAGCGMVCCEDTAEISVKLLQTDIPLLLDADALNSTAAYSPDSLGMSRAKPLVITPHIGEMSRLNGLSVDAIKQDPDHAALTFAAKNGCITVLKDHFTRVASPDGRLYINRTGNAGLARGGSGDLLSGIIASFIAQGIDAYDAAVCGVYLHGMAGDRCASRLSQYAMLPSDILNDLAEIFLENGR